MKKYIYVFCLIGLSLPVLAAPTIYRGVERRSVPHINHHPDPVFNHQASQPVSRPRYPAYSYPPHTDVYIHRPQIAVVTPHVGIYVDPEPQYHYQKTEEIYLPQGGTYRSTTEYVPQYPVSNDPKRRIINRGKFYSNLDERLE